MSTAQQGNVRHLLPGSNTREGFFSYFSYLWRPLGHPRPRRVWILKGGPGTGKSVFMRRISEEMVHRGHDAEWHHCAADPDSIDGLVFPELGAAIVDGTSPHRIDPSFPGAVDELINLGEDWDAGALRAARAEIEVINARYKELYAAGYRYLAAAGTLHDEWRQARAAVHDWGQVHELGWSMLLDWVRGRRAGSPGFVRKLFGSAITPDGPRHHLDTLVAQMEWIVVLKGEPGTGKSTLVSRWAQGLAEHGFDLELLHCGFHPREPEHLLVPALGLAVVSSEAPHRFDGRSRLPGERERAGAARLDVIDLDRFTSFEGSPTHRRRVQEAERLFWSVFQTATDCLKRARDLHAELENIYAPQMDFDRVEARRRALMDELSALTA